MKRHIAVAVVVLGLTAAFTVESFFPFFVPQAAAKNDKIDN